MISHRGSNQQQTEEMLIMSQYRPWALALGTPVLVIAGLLHLIHDCTKKRVKKMATGSIMKSNAPSMSEV